MNDLFNVDMSIPKLRKKAFVKGVIYTFTTFPQELEERGNVLLNDYWKFMVVRQSHGWCNYSARIITIPEWVMLEQHQAYQKGYKIWYLAHEMSHAFGKKEYEHGPQFMALLKEICPKEYIHHELDYKPRNAAAAGIAVPSASLKTLGF